MSIEKRTPGEAGSVDTSIPAPQRDRGQELNGAELEAWNRYKKARDTFEGHLIRTAKQAGIDYDTIKDWLVELEGHTPANDKRELGRRIIQHLQGKGVREDDRNLLQTEMEECLDELDVSFKSAQPK